MSPWFRRRRRRLPPELPPAAESTALAYAEPDPGLAEPDTGVVESDSGVVEADSGVVEVDSGVAEPEAEPDPTGPLSPDRLDSALRRLRQEIPAPSEESPPEPSA
jgi:hypothetical protein